MYLTHEFRCVVTTAIQDHAVKRSWQIYALNVRTNHVHVVVGAYPYIADLVMQQFKEWGTRYLTQSGYVQRGRRVWADHGSTRWLDSPESLSRAIAYVNEQQ